MSELRTRVNEQLAGLADHPRVRQFLPSVDRINRHDLVDRSAALTYYGLLGIVPAMLVLYSVLGLLGSRATVADALSVFGGLLPDGDGDTARQKFTDALRDEATSSTLLGLGLLGVLWTASAFVGSFFRASATIWNVPRRPVWRAWPARVALTLALLVLICLLAITVVVTGELATSVGDLIGLTSQTVALYEILKWPAVIVAILLLLGLLYRTSPHTPHPYSLWWLLTPGVTFAGIAWLIVSGGFTVYVNLFGSYQTTYGALGTTIASMVWLWLSNLVLLAGVTVDAELGQLRPAAGDAA